MKKKSAFLVLIVFLCSILSGCVKISSKMILKLKKGDSFKVQVDKNRKIQSDSSGSINLKVREGFLCNVVEVSDSKDMDIKVTVDSIDFTNNTEGLQNLKKYISNTDIFFDDLKSIYPQFLGKSFKIKISENGKVEKVMGIDEFTNGILTELKDKSKEKLVKNFIKNEFSEDVLEGKIQRLVSFYSDKKVGVGDKWNETHKVLVKVPIEAESEYTLKDCKEGTCDISMQSKIKKRTSQEPINVDNMKISYDDIKGEEKGDIVINKDNKLIKTEEIESKYGGKVKVSYDDPNKGTEKIPISVEEKISVNVMRQ